MNLGVPLTSTEQPSTPIRGLSRPAVGPRELIALLWRRKWLIVALSVGLTVLAFFAIKDIAPTYSAETTLMFDPRPTNVGPEELLSLIRGAQPALESQIEVIHSRGLADRVVDALVLNTIPEFNPALVPPSGVRAIIGDIRAAVSSQLPTINSGQEADDADTALEARRDRDRVVDNVLGNLTVGQIGDSQVIRLQFESEDPALAAEIANTYAELYITQQLEARFEAVREATEWLSDRLARLRAQTEESEQRLADYRGQLTGIGNRDPAAVVIELETVGNQVAEARAEADARRARYGSVLNAYRSRGPDAVADAVGSNVVNSLRISLAQLLQQRVELANQYDVRHPALVQIDGQIASVRAEFDTAVASFLETLRIDVASAEQELARLEEHYERVQAVQLEVNQGEVQMRVLERQAEANRILFDTFLSRTREAEQLSLDEPEAWIISAASVPLVPDGPSKAVLMVVATMAAGGFAVGLAALLELLSGTFNSRDEIEGILGVPVFGMVPRIGSAWPFSELRSMRARTRDLNAAAHSAVHSAVTTAGLADGGRRGSLTMLITSGQQGDGKTFLALAIAQVVVSLGQRPLIIDANLRRPAAARQLGVRSAPGLIDILTGAVSPEDAVTASEDGTVSVIPPGHGRGQESRLGTAPMAELVRRMRLEYDVVIIDCPEAVDVPDARLIAQLADVHLVVVQWRRSLRRRTSRAIEQLRTGTDAPIGAILSLVPPGQISAE